MSDWLWESLLVYATGMVMQETLDPQAEGPLFFGAIPADLA